MRVIGETVKVKGLDKLFPESGIGGEGREDSRSGKKTSELLGRSSD